MNFLKSLLTNSVLMSALYSWLIAQFLKIIIEMSRKNRFRTKDFILRAIFGTGGMPSSHSATIAAVTISIGIVEGLNTSVFALAVVMFIIVIRDATGVRLSTGKQAKAINQLIETLNKSQNCQFEKIKEVRGHTSLETFVGILVGVLVSLGLHLKYFLT